MKLTRLESSWAEAAMGAIFPGSVEAGLSDIRTMDVGGFLRALMREVPWRAALGIRLAVWLAALAPLVVIGRLATISRLGPVDRERVLAALIASRWYAVRSLALLLKAVGAFLYADDLRVRARMTSAPTSSLVSLGVNRIRAA